MSTQEKAVLDKLNSSLPVKLNSSSLEGRPEFTRLLLSLVTQLSDNGTSSALAKDLKQVESDLQVSRKAFLQEKVLYAELQELLVDYHIKHADQRSTKADEQFAEMLQECVTRAESMDYLSFDPSGQVTLLGITPEDIHRFNPYIQHVSAIQQRLLPELEERLYNKQENLLAFYEPVSTTGHVFPPVIPDEDEEYFEDSDRLKFAKAIKLPSLVETDQLKLKDDKKALEQDREQRERQFWMFYQSLLDSANKLETLISNYRHGEQARNDQITCEYLMASFDAFDQKVRLLELQVLCDTYQAETVHALKSIRRYLEQTQKMTEKEYQETLHSLEAYDAIGLGFDELVAEYTELRNEVENKEWSLKQLSETSSAHDHPHPDIPNEHT